MLLSNLYKVTDVEMVSLIMCNHYVMLCYQFFLHSFFFVGLFHISFLWPLWSNARKIQNHKYLCFMYFVLFLAHEKYKENTFLFTHSIHFIYFSSKKEKKILFVFYHCFFYIICYICFCIKDKFKKHAHTHAC